jgi:hypothetical protein
VPTGTLTDLPGGLHAAVREHAPETILNRGDRLGDLGPKRAAVVRDGQADGDELLQTEVAADVATTARRGAHVRPGRVAHDCRVDLLGLGRRLRDWGGSVRSPNAGRRRAPENERPERQRQQRPSTAAIHQPLLDVSPADCLVRVGIVPAARPRGPGLPTGTAATLAPHEVPTMGHLTRSNLVLPGKIVRRTTAD